jgi:peptidoglycan/xylan/chitin deacetylase (PgdA/CDA1 family)
VRGALVAFAITSPLLLIALWPFSPLGGVALLLLSHALLLYPTLSPNCQWFGPVLTSFATTENEVWLTVDDGPADDTVRILDALDARNAKATFFFKGSLVEGYADVVKQVIARGHGVGNHSQTHPSGTFWCATPRRVRHEIDSCSDSLARATGERPVLFRAPVGHKNPAVHAHLARRGMTLIGWSVRGFDGVRSKPAAVVRRVVRNVFPGAIIVLHQGRGGSPELIATVVDELQRRRYAFVIPPAESLKTKR